MLLRWARSFLKRVRLVDSEFNNVSEGNATYTYPLLFQWAITIKSSLSNTDIIIISSNYIACSRHDRAENCSLVGIPLTGLTAAHFCQCHNPRPGFRTPYFVVLSSWCERWMYVLLIHIRLLTIIVCCLNFLFIIITRKREWVGDCCLAPNEQFLALSWREHAI
jgi:hypothetical protein